MKKKLNKLSMAGCTLMAFAGLTFLASCNTDDPEHNGPDPVEVTVPETGAFTALGLNRYSAIPNSNAIPQMHREGTKLMVCTADGLFAYDLVAEHPQWISAGFEGRPIQDYVKNAKNDIIALCQTKTAEAHDEWLILSHDNGKTWTDITPSIIKDAEYTEVRRIAQSPVNPDKLLVVAQDLGVFLSEDFGANWTMVTDTYYGNNRICGLGFHPTNPDVFFQSGESWILEGHLNLTMDNGKTWTNYSPDFGGDNCIHGLVFHPTKAGTWFYGGEGIIAKTTDAGKTWKEHNYWETPEMRQYWYHVLVDLANPERLYTVGSSRYKTGDDSRYSAIAFSDDCGENWNISKTFNAEGEWKDDCWSVLQDEYHLYVLSDTEVYMISKSLIR